MADTDALFSRSISELYDQYLGPLLFEPYARELAARLAGTTSGRVLETAAGTGVLTRELVGALPESVEILATDLNQPMLDHAASRTSTSRVKWRQADAHSLPEGDGEFKAVVCQFGVMFFADRVGAYREAHRVLAPGGLLAVSVWDRIEHNELAVVVTSALGEMFPDDPPRFLERVPHGYHDQVLVERELKDAGFADISITCVAKRSVAANARDPAIGFCQGSPLRNEIEARDKGRLSEATEVAAAAIVSRFGNGPVDGKMQGYIVTAVRR